MRSSNFFSCLACQNDLDQLGHIERSAASIFRDAALAWLVNGDTMDPAVLVGFLAAHELDGVFHIAEVSVAQSHQRRGTGGRLIEAAIEHGRLLEFGAITLSTYRDLSWNGPFYARLRFCEIDPYEAGLSSTLAISGG